jgi:hypothetical protein
MKKLLATMLVCALAAAAGAAAFVGGTPPETFMADCLVRSHYSDETALNVCKEELLHLRFGRALGTTFATLGTLVIMPALAVLLFVLSVWVPLMFRRRR